ncbi:hypothetical protein [Luteibacter rhizovicinus]|nr:hypothetical protein [Luteibacter rhizovicinus]
MSLALQRAALDTEMLDLDRIAIVQKEGLRRSEALLKRELQQFAQQLKLTRQQSESGTAF